MDEDNKLSLKRVELSLTKFNEVAIPHHLDLLRQHKANIIKHERCGEVARARTEQQHAARVAAQLRALLLELDVLRAQVRPSDLARFDQVTQRARDSTLRAVLDCLGTSPLTIHGRKAEEEQPAASVTSTESVGVVRGGGEEPEETPPLHQLAHVQLYVDPHEQQLAEREALLAGWTELQQEVMALHEAWRRTHEAAAAHRLHVDSAAASVHAAADNVSEARARLASAERMRAGAYGMGGACVGALLGGPLGLAAGAKAGALGAAAGSLLGYLGARLLRPRQLPDELAERTQCQQTKDKHQ